jgi:acetyl-CoA C-acetyltransferase
MDVGIVGAVRLATDPGERLEEFAFRAASGALADAGIAHADIDHLTIATSDELDGRSISSMVMAMPAGGMRKDEIKVQDSALHALMLAGMRIAAGEFDLGLLVSWCCSSQTPHVEMVDVNALEPFVERPSGVVESVAAALTATAYLHQFGRSIDDLDRRAAAKRGMSGADFSAPWIAHPLRTSHFGTVVDGAAALVLASPKALREREFPHSPVTLRGIGWATDTYALAERDLASFAALKNASAMAMTRSGIGLESIDHFELIDRNVVYETMAVEALGLAAPGTGFDGLSNGLGRRVNNLTTTAFTGLPLFCGGLVRTAEAVHTLRRHKVSRVLLHDASGIRAQNHTVAILEGSNT